MENLQTKPANFGFSTQVTWIEIKSFDCVALLVFPNFLILLDQMAQFLIFLGGGGVVMLKTAFPLFYSCLFQNESLFGKGQF